MGQMVEKKDGIPEKGLMAVASAKRERTWCARRGHHCQDRRRNPYPWEQGCMKERRMTGEQTARRYVVALTSGKS